MRPDMEDLNSRGRVATLGMFIIDHFEVKDEEGKAISLDIESIGGGGVFAMVSARMFLPASHVGLIVDEGVDFPAEFEKQLYSFGSEMIYWRTRRGKTTRALNIYSGRTIGEGHQTFRYLAPQLNLHFRDLILPPSPLAQPRLPEWVHVVARTNRAQDLIQELQAIEASGVGGVGQGWAPRLIWEPLVALSGDVELDVDEWIKLAQCFDIVSPNHLELRSILEFKNSAVASASEAEQAELDAHDLYAALTTAHPETRVAHPAVVVRVGKYGCYTVSRNWHGWTPAYWRDNEQHEVVDPTGGGNAFLGGLAAGMLIKDDLRYATILASVAASFVIQQRGLPQFEASDGSELWNNSDPWARASELDRRMAVSM